MKKIKIISFTAVLIVIVSVYSHFFQAKDMALAGAGDNLSGFAWSDNIGWISFNSSDCDADNNGVSDGTPAGCPLAGTSIPNYGVNVNTDETMSGFAWSDNVGWIDFGPTSGYPEAPLNGGKLTKSTGLVSGWAKAVAGNIAESGGWDGWIKLGNDSNSDGVYDNGSNTNIINDYGIVADLFDAGSCDWSGWVWGGGGDTGVVGWIKFDVGDLNGDGVDDGVKGTGRPACAEGNKKPIAEAGISVTEVGSYGINVSTTTGKTNIFLSANKDLNGDGKFSRDPNGWGDLAFGVRNGGSCEWFKNYGFATTTINKKDNPRNPTSGDCNLTLTNEDFSSTGRYNYSLVITDIPGLKSATSTVSVNVTAAAVFDYSLSANDVNVVKGSSISNLINVNLISGTTESVTLSVQSVTGTGVTATFNTGNSCSPSCNKPLTISADSTATLGVHTVTIEGTSSSGISKTTTFDVTVTVALLPLTATCSGAVLGMTIAWTANPSGGASPYAYSWSGDDGLSGAVKDVFKTYTSAGTKNAQVIVTEQGGSSVTSSCSATPTSALINGACGTANGQSFPIKPTTGLCSSGNSTTVSGSGPWSWTCTGINGGTDSSCSASLAVGGGGGSSSSVGWGWIWRPR